MNKLSLTEKRVGRMSRRNFFKLYKQYKNTFDLEMQLTKLSTTYKEQEEKAYREEQWF